MPSRLPSLATLLLALAAAGAHAQDVRLYGAQEAVDPQEVSRILGQRPMKMRSIRLLDDAPAAANKEVAQAALEPEAGARAEPAALALPVQFAFDSADILPAARPQLDALAEGIRRLPAPRRVVIEGHTDGVGREAYNDHLSQRRAQAVKRYLVAEHRIEAERLRAVGLGQHEPLPGHDPLAGANRRVQFRGE